MAITAYRRLRYASPTVNKVSPLQGFSQKSRRDGTLLTVGEIETHPFTYTIRYRI
jgi:hypothetical protein